MYCCFTSYSFSTKPREAVLVGLFKGLNMIFFSFRFQIRDKKSHCCVSLELGAGCSFRFVSLVCSIITSLGGRGT